MKLLLTNDDGINAVGLRTLWEGLKDIGEIVIVAPMEQQTGKGASVTIGSPLRAESIGGFERTSALMLNGTPADCVKVGLGKVLDFSPDLIVSGINHGANDGRGIYSSGTAGCIIQGTLQGVPGIAFSYTCNKSKTFPHVKKYLAPIVQYVFDHPLPKGTFLNVNFPSKEIQGVKLARQGLSFWQQNLRKMRHPEGHLEFHLDEIPNAFEEHPESDSALLEKGFITAVPIHVNELTDHKHFDSHKGHFDSHFEIT